MRDMIAALERGDIDHIDRTTSREPGVVAIGSDPGEYSRERDQIIELMRQSTPEVGMHIHAGIDEIRGYEDGDVGWADGTGSFTRDGDSVSVRFTGVARREDGEWRIVQTHASIGVPNDHIFDALFRAEHAGAST
jgi:ketosteroid isomerase-like protein